MRRNLDKWMADGERKLEKHMAYDLQLPEIYAEVSRAEKHQTLAELVCEVFTRAFYLGIESGYRMKKQEIKKKRSAAR